MSRRSSGFTLAEVLLAVLLLSIAAFGYIALHERLIYSNWRLEERQVPREQARQALTQQVSSVRAGGTSDQEDVEGVQPGLVHLRAEATGTAGRDEVRYTVDTYEVQRRPGW